MQPGSFTELAAAVIAGLALLGSIVGFVVNRSAARSAEAQAYAAQKLAERSAAAAERSAAASKQAADEAARSNEVAGTEARQRAADRETDRFGMDIFLTSLSNGCARLQLRHRGTDIARRVTLSTGDPRDAPRFEGLPIGATLQPGDVWDFTADSDCIGDLTHLELEWADHAPRNIPMPSRRDIALPPQVF